MANSGAAFPIGVAGVIGIVVLLFIFTCCCCTNSGGGSSGAGVAARRTRPLQSCFFETYAECPKLNNQITTCIGCNISIPGTNPATSNCKFDASEVPCICGAIASSPCNPDCSRTGGSLPYVAWILDVCNSEYDDTFLNATKGGFQSLWEGYPVLDSQALREVFPWRWNLTRPPDSVATNVSSSVLACTSTAVKFEWLGIVNLVVLISMFVLGRRTVIARLSCQFLGRPASPWWVVSATMTVLLAIFGNLINAYLMKQYAGFGHASAGQLWLLFFTRPRIAWMAVYLQYIDRERLQYISLAASAIMAESILQLFGAYYLGRTVDYGRVHRLYLGILKPIPRLGHARTMYAGALLWLVSISIAILLYVIVGIRISAATSLIRQSIGNRLTQRSQRDCADDYLSPRVLDRIFGIRGNTNRDLGSGQGPAMSMHQGQARIGEPLGLTETFGPIDMSGHFGSVQDLEFDEALQRMGLEDRLKSIQLGDRLHELGLRERLQRMNPLTRLQQIAIFRNLQNMHPIQRLKRVGVSNRLEPLVLLTCFVLPFLGQWLFWAGFILTADDLFCPSNLASISVIWALSEILGIIMGAAL